MDASDASADSRKEAALLEKRLRDIIDEKNLVSQREVILRTAEQLNVSLLDCAAALLYLNQPPVPSQAEAAGTSPKGPIKSNYRFVRYRLDVGSRHDVSKEQIQAVLIEESGVDKKRIGRIDIRHNYTLVELPDGMPADIFQLLSEAGIGEHKLAIKRVKPNRRRPREAGDNA